MTESYPPLSLELVPAAAVAAAAAQLIDSENAQLPFETATATEATTEAQAEPEQEQEEVPLYQRLRKVPRPDYRLPKFPAPEDTQNAEEEEDDEDEGDRHSPELVPRRQRRRQRRKLLLRRSGRASAPAEDSEPEPEDEAEGAEAGDPIEEDELNDEDEDDEVSRRAKETSELMRFRWEYSQSQFEAESSTPALLFGEESQQLAQSLFDKTARATPTPRLERRRSSFLSLGRTTMDRASIEALRRQNSYQNTFTPGALFSDDSLLGPSPRTPVSSSRVPHATPVSLSREDSLLMDALTARPKRPNTPAAVPAKRPRFEDR